MSPKAKPPELNALIRAIQEAKPLPPPLPWQTIHELMEATGLSEHRLHIRLNALTKSGKLERMKAPRRTDGCGCATYYRVKNGKS